MAFLEVSIFVCVCLSLCVHFLLIQHQKEDDESLLLITPEKIGESNLSSILPPLVYGIIRGIMACSIWYLDISYLRDPHGIIFTTMISTTTSNSDENKDDGQQTNTSNNDNNNNNKKGERLFQYHLKGFQRMIPFSDWSLILQGIYFTFSSYQSMAIAINRMIMNNDQQLPHGSFLPVLPIVLQNITYILYEISLPIAFVISFIVTYIIIPTKKRQGLSIDHFFSFNGLMLHTANIWFITFECLTNQLSLSLVHIPYVILYGLLYIVFAWCWHYGYGFYYYSFLDYHNSKAIVYYCGLLIVLVIMYLMCWVFTSSSWAQEYPVITYLGMFVLLWSATKIRDS